MNCVGELTEKMIHKRMLGFIERKCIYPQEMNGFRRHRSAVDNIIHLVSSVQEELDSRSIPIAIFLDLKQAFDSATNAAMLTALAAHGFGGRLNAWIKNYLDRRQLFMRTLEGDTSCYPARKGVPQGAVLSPLLFFYPYSTETEPTMRSQHHNLRK